VSQLQLLTETSSWHPAVPLTKPGCCEQGGSFAPSRSGRAVGRQKMQKNVQDISTELLYIYIYKERQAHALFYLDLIQFMETESSRGTKCMKNQNPV